MNTEAKTSLPLFRRLSLGLSPWLIVGMAAILGLAIAALSVKNAQRERGYMTQNMTDRAEALIWALEAGTRTWMGMHGGNARLLQALVEETAKQPGIVFMAVVDSDGVILAHSDSSKIGDTLEKPAPEETAGTPAWRVRDWDGKKVFEVFRTFVPLRAGHHFSGRRRDWSDWRPKGRRPYREHADTAPREHMDMDSRDRMGMGHRGRMGMGPRDLDDAPPVLPDTVFVGLDRQPFEDALAQDFKNSVFSAGLVAAMGLAGVISLFWAHNYRRSRRMLRDSQAMAAEVVTNLPLGLLTGDPAGNVAVVNDTALALLGMRRKDVFGAPLAQLPGLDWGLLVNELAGKEKILERDATLQAPGARPASVSLSAAAMRNDDGVFLGNLFILRDTTEIKRLQAEARRNERLAGLGKLASGVAHEIRNPLSTIKGVATYLAKRTQPGGREEEAANTMVAEVDRLNRVVSGLLDFARPAAITLSETSPREVVDRALRLAEADIKARRIRVSIEEEPDFPTVFVSPERLTQALLNLFLNAVQAMEPGGELRVEIRRQPGAGTFSLTVGDTGKGIPEADQAFIFTPYFTTKPSGTGLGLAIVHQIAEGHGGSIRVDSAPGAGAEFTITLPLQGKENA